MQKWVGLEMIPMIYHINPNSDRGSIVTQINPIVSEWKLVGIELMIPMVYHT